MIFGACYEPDLGPSAPITTMLCENLVRLGHQVTVIATVPYYPTGRVPAEYRGKLKWFWKSNENGVDVVRVGLPSLDRSKLPLRLIQFAFMQLGTAVAGIGKRYDAVMAYTSSLSVWLPFATMVVLAKKPAIYSVADVYPAVGIALGIFRNKTIISLIAAMERFCLNHAKVVRIISDSFRPDLLAMGVPDEKLVLVYDWVDIDLICPQPRDNSFAREHGLADRFVIMYAGNIGLSQGLDNVLNAAEKLAADKDICFVLVGDGSNRQCLIDETERRQLKNVKFIPFQPRKCLPEVLATADISLVSLQPGIGTLSIPSKTMSILASGRPIIACIDDNAEVVKLINKAESGLCVPPDNPSKLVEAILKLKEDAALRDRLGHNGRIWAENQHSPQVGAKTIAKLLQDISSKN
jgi:colanic acid biosynthesis glycosyl transferase WcaI